MAIRLRKVDGELVALCAAESEFKVGDIYLDDNAHHALIKKFEEDFKNMGFWYQDDTKVNVSKDELEKAYEFYTKYLNTPSLRSERSP